ncbi:MAG: C39 family peptidase [Cyanobacteriota bacterium]
MSSVNSVSNNQYTNQEILNKNPKIEKPIIDESNKPFELVNNKSDSNKIDVQTSKTNVIKSLPLLEESSNVIYNSKSESYKEWFTPQYADYESKYGNFHFSGINVAENDKILNNPTKNSKEVLEENQTWRTAYSSCGPATALMTLKANDFGKNLSIAEMRSNMNVPKRGAVTSDSISKAIEKISDNKLDADINKAKVKESPQAFLNRMKEEIKDDNMVILLTQFMDEDTENKASNVGHYVIVNGFKGDNLLVVNPFTINEEQEIPFEEFKQAYDHRKEIGGQPNLFISVSDET